jgi:preprotein translocase subunit SecD
VTDKQAATATLTSTARLELYWLRDLETQKKPKGKWEMLGPETDENGSDIYSFMNKSTKEVVKGDTPKGRERILLKVANAYDPVKNPKGVKPILTGDDLLPNAKGEFMYHRPVVLVEFNDKGTKIFRDFTKKHVGDVVAIFFGGRILTAPSIYEPIPTGKAEISGFSTLKEATDTARILNAGTLPVPLRVLSVTDV